MPYKPIAISHQSVCKNPLKRTIFPQVFLHSCILGEPHRTVVRLVNYGPHASTKSKPAIGKQFCKQNCRRVVLPSFLILMSMILFELNKALSFSFWQYFPLSTILVQVSMSYLITCLILYLVVYL